MQLVSDELPEMTNKKQDRLRRRAKEIDSEDKDTRYVTVAWFVNAQCMYLPHFPLTKAKLSLSF